MKPKNIFSLIFGVLLLTTLIAKSQEDHTREFKERFSINKSTLIEVESKYGDVKINNWDRPEIDIQAEIILRDINRQKADQVFEYINIEISKAGEVIHLETEIEEEFFRLVGKNYQADDGKFQINYNIKVPVYAKMDVENKYGNLFINELASQSVISIKYGNLKINKLTGNGKDGMVDLELGYSNGTVESCEWLKIMSKYSKLNIGKSKALIIVSKYSKMEIDAGSSIVCESKYDTYQVGVLANFVAEAQYSNYRFDEIYKKINLETKYTDVRVERIPAGFESIVIENAYGSMKFGIDNDASYKLKAYAKYAKISYPESRSRVNRFQENTEQRVEGIVGEDNESAGLVKIDTKYGGISLDW